MKILYNEPDHIRILAEGRIIILREMPTGDIQLEVIDAYSGAPSGMLMDDPPKPYLEHRATQAIIPTLVSQP